MFPEITAVELVEMSEEEVVEYNDKHGVNLFDDNGGEADGDSYLIPASEVENCEQYDIVSGYEVEGYTEPSNYVSWTGFSSRNRAYTTDYEIAQAIVHDERGLIE